MARLIEFQAQQGGLPIRRTTIDLDEVITADEFDDLSQTLVTLSNGRAFYLQMLYDDFIVTWRGDAE